MTIHFPNRSQKAIVKQLLEAGLAAARPDIALGRFCNRQNEILNVAKRVYRLSSYNRIVCVGIGKASASMVHTIEQLLENRLDSGLLVVKDLPRSMPQNIEVLKAGHPTPDKNSLKAAKAVQQFVNTLTHRDLLIVLISGGTSSLVTAPAPSLTLNDKQRTTDLLLRCGANIQEMNVVRKHLSTIKGGQLAASTRATVISFILSDVIGDDIATIGSGLTAPDPSTFQQAKHILQQYELWKIIPATVRQYIQKGIRKTIPETPKPNNSKLGRVQNVVIGNNQLTVQAIRKRAKQMGLSVTIEPCPMHMEAKDLGRHIAELARRINDQELQVRRPACFLWGGEPTVTMAGRRKGGRAQECALAAAIGLAGLRNMIMAGFGTDGSDGPTDAAGAVVNGNTIKRGIDKGIDPQRTLNSHDSYRFFQDVGGHIKTGPTGTNVNDVYILLKL